MIVVLDASPLIFLGKLGCLDLLVKVAGHDLHLAESVHAEVAGFAAEGLSRDRLEKFLASCTVHRVRRSMREIGSLSRADTESLSLAIKLSAGMILADDRLLRRVAEAEGIRVLGTLGVILRSVESGFLASSHARAAVDTLIGEHHFRIGIEVYQYVLVKLDESR